MSTAPKKKTLQEVVQDKASKLMEGVAYWGAFYRENPQRFVKDYLNVTLKLFQKILIFAMMHNNYFMYLASRGQGKTWLTAIFCVVRAILFPGSKIVICSATRSQANEVLLKITDDLCKNYGWGSANLNNEISFKAVGANKAVIEFKNGSWIRVVTASDSGRGARANVLIVDEFRLVDLDTINTVLRRFLTAPRTPGYLHQPEYQYLVERNKELYMSSCWYKSHWSFEKVKAYFKNMLDDTKKYFVCSLPYQLAIMENLLSREQVEDEMSESDFDPIKFSMEMEALFFGDLDGAFFSYEDVSKRRKIKNSFYPLRVYEARNMKIPDLAFNERRILSVDVALLSSTKKKKNDASAIFINCAVPVSNTRYQSNFVYGESFEGLTTDDLGIIVMRYFYHYKCTDIALDTNGLGLGVFDFIIQDQYDSETGETYRGLSCCNDPDMAARCKISDAKKVIWSIKAKPEFNSRICIDLRTGFQNGRVNLLVSEFEAEEIIMNSYKQYAKLSVREQLDYKMSYIQTSLLINELINLQYWVNGANVKLFERSGMRKDRYSSVAYNYWVVNQIEQKVRPEIQPDALVSTLTIRRANIYHSF